MPPTPEKMYNGSCHCQAPSFSSEPLPTLLSCRKAKLQASAFNPWPHGFATPKHHLISCRNDVQKWTAKMSNVTSENLSKKHRKIVILLLQLLLPILLLQLLLPLLSFSSEPLPYLFRAERPSSRFQLSTLGHTASPHQNTT